jgi:hypothetical protein
MDWPPGGVIPDWRRVTIVAPVRLADRLTIQASSMAQRESVAVDRPASKFPSLESCRCS